MTDQAASTDGRAPSGENVPTGNCRREGCPVANGSGQCALGHANPLDCPEFELADDLTRSEPSDAPTSVNEGAVAPAELRGRHPILMGGNSIVLPSGLFMTVAEANEILHAREATVAVPI